MEEKIYYLGFSLFPGIGSKRFLTLLATFKSVKKAWEADENALTEVLGEALAKKFVSFRKTFSFDQELSKLSTLGISFLIPSDRAYPSLLKQLPTHPYVLYIKGNADVFNFPKTIGVVGTRKISSYGIQVTQSFTEELVHVGFVIISGLALGVDALAHETTIESKGQTIAVLGCGVDCCSPRENQKIYDAILSSGGAIVSTFRPGEQANRGTFPARNAIIAGLSLGVLVTEGAADSGALITADYAKKFERPIFAVPGPITSGLSQGPNLLLQQGAIPVTNGMDILRVIPNSPCLPAGRFRDLPNNKKMLKPFRQAQDKQVQHDRRGGNPEEQKILDMIQLSPLHFDEIVRTIGKSAQEVGSVLSVMELKGMIRNDAGFYSLLI